MSATIHKLDCDMTGNPAAVLNDAAISHLAEVLVLGWDEAGGFYIRSSTGEIGGMLWLIEEARKELVG